MKRKFFSLKEMAQAKFNADILRGHNKKKSVYINHFNGDDIIHTSSRLINDDIKLNKNPKRPTKRKYSNKQCPHFSGKVNS